MHLAAFVCLISLVALSPQRTQGVCDELRPLRQDLLNIQRQQGPKHAHVVSDARVQALEKHLARFLDLPQTVRVRLTTTSGHRRDVTDKDSVGFNIEHRASNLDFGMWTVPWSGECVGQGVVQFQNQPSSAAVECGRHSTGTHYRSDLRRTFFEELSELAEAMAATQHSFVTLPLSGGSREKGNAFAKAMVSLRAGVPEAERSISAWMRLPLDESEAPGSAGPGPRIEAAELAQVLDDCLDWSDKFRLDFPHSIRVAPDSLDASLLHVNFSPYGKGHRPLPVRASFRRSPRDAERWMLEDTRRALPSDRVAASDFSALLRDISSLLTARQGRLGALGLAWEAETSQWVARLLVLSDGSIWSSTEAQLLTFRPGKVREFTVAEEALRNLRTPRGTPAGRLVREAELSNGELLHIAIDDGDFFVKEPLGPVMRVGELEHHLVGGFRVR